MRAMGFARVLSFCMNQNCTKGEFTYTSFHPVGPDQNTEEHTYPACAPCEFA